MSPLERRCLPTDPTPTSARARRIEALALPDAEEDALLGISHRCADGLKCRADAASIRTLMGYGKQPGDLNLFVDAIQRLEDRGLIVSEEVPGSRYTRIFTILVDQW